MKTYEETLAYLFAQLPMYQNIGTRAIKKDLTNIRYIMDQLGSPHESFPSIHIAGTNGKGTTAHLIASILQQSGLKVGLYTSPHYVDFRERIKINGTYISKEFVVQFTQKLKSSISRIQPSFFEISVAMAFEYLKTEKIDIAIFETGLGGRLDSTNIIDPILSVITNISKDHVEMLGPDLLTIAGQKAGVIKPGRPVVIGRYQTATDLVFLKTAAIKSSSISFASVNWSIEKNEAAYSFMRKGGTAAIRDVCVESSPFMIENVMTTLEAIYIYQQETGRNIREKDISSGIRDFRKLSNYSGRWQILHDKPLIIADSAHNFEAIKSVLDHLKQYEFGRIHFVLGFVKGKEIRKILKLFDVHHRYYLTCPSVPRGLAVGQLAKIADEVKLKGAKFQTVAEAVRKAKENANEHDLIFIGGSSFVVAEALGMKEYFV